MIEEKRSEPCPAAPYAQTIEALRAAAGELLKARDEEGAPGLAAAVHRNGLVWALLIEETAAPDNTLPVHLRDTIRECGIEAIKLGQEILLGRDMRLVDTLIETGIRTARSLKAG